MLGFQTRRHDNGRGRADSLTVRATGINLQGRVVNKGRRGPRRSRPTVIRQICVIRDPRR